MKTTLRKTAIFVRVWRLKWWFVSLFTRIHYSDFTIQTRGVKFNECITHVSGDEVLTVGSIVHAMKHDKDIRNLLIESVQFYQDEVDRIKPTGLMDSRFTEC